MSVSSLREAERASWDSPFAAGTGEALFAGGRRGVVAGLRRGDATERAVAPRATKGAPVGRGMRLLEFGFGEVVAIKHESSCNAFRVPATGWSSHSSRLFAL